MPVLGSADVNLMADAADAVVLAVRARRSTSRDVRKAVDQIGANKVVGWRSKTSPSSNPLPEARYKNASWRVPSGSSSETLRARCVSHARSSRSSRYAASAIEISLSEPVMPGLVHLPDHSGFCGDLVVRCGRRIKRRAVSRVRRCTLCTGLHSVQRALHHCRGRSFPDAFRVASSVPS